MRRSLASSNTEGGTKKGKSTAWMYLYYIKRKVLHYYRALCIRYTYTFGWVPIHRSAMNHAMDDVVFSRTLYFLCQRCRVNIQSMRMKLMRVQQPPRFRFLLNNILLCNLIYGFFLYEILLKHRTKKNQLFSHFGFYYYILFCRCSCWLVQCELIIYHHFNQSETNFAENKNAARKLVYSRERKCSILSPDSIDWFAWRRRRTLRTLRTSTWCIYQKHEYLHNNNNFNTFSVL